MQHTLKRGTSHAWHHRHAWHAHAAASAWAAATAACRSKKTNKKYYIISIHLYMYVCVRVSAYMHVLMFTYTSTLFIAQNQGPRLRP